MSHSPVSLDIQRFLEHLDAEESLELEFKSAQGGLPRSIWPTLSAFANTVGGWVVLGITEDQQGGLSLQGVPNPSLLVDQLHNQVRDPQKISYPVCGPTDIRVEAVGDRRVVVVRVKPARRSARPVYISNNPYGGTYVRRQTGDYPCTRDEVERMMREAADLPADGVVLEAFGWDDLDRDAFRSYRQRFQTHNSASPWNGYDDDAFLEAIGGYRTDRDAGREGITVAGLLMFGKDGAIRERRGRHLIDFRVLPPDSEIPSADWVDRVVWEGHLFGAFFTIMPRLADGLPAPLQFDGVVRVGETTWQLALREALVNLLAHADYHDRAASLVVRSDRGCFFRNPGSSRVPELGPLTRDRSDPRNPALVRMFRFIGLAEEAGSGIPRIFAAWRELGFLPPEIDVGIERPEFSIELRYVHALSQEDRAWLAWLGGPWSEPEQLALVVAKHVGEIDNGTLRGITGLHPADATKVLVGLRDRGLLLMTGSGRGARYQIEPEALAAPTAEMSKGPVSITAPLGTITVPSESSTAHSATFQDDRRLNLEHSGASIVDEPIWQRLEEIAKPVASVDYIDARERDDVIVALCAARPLSLTELMWLVGREKAYLRRVVKGLVVSGRLQYRYPDKPRHREQRYLAPRADQETPE